MSVGGIGRGVKVRVRMRFGVGAGVRLSRLGPGGSWMRALGATSAKAPATALITSILSRVVLCRRRHCTANVPSKPCRAACTSGSTACTMLRTCAEQLACTGSMRTMCGAPLHREVSASSITCSTILMGSSASPSNRIITLPAQPVCATENAGRAPAARPPCFSASISRARASPAVPSAAAPAASPFGPAAFGPAASLTVPNRSKHSRMALCSRWESHVMITPRMPAVSSVPCPNRRFFAPPPACAPRFMPSFFEDGV